MEDFRALSRRVALRERSKDDAAANEEDAAMAEEDDGRTAPACFMASFHALRWALLLMIGVVVEEERSEIM